MTSGMTESPSFLKKVGILAGGLLMLAVFAFWPMYQAAQGEQQITLSFKGVAVASMLTVIGLNLVFLGDKGIPWKKTKEQALTGVQKLVAGATVAAGVGLVAFVWYFFQQRGYHMGF